MENFAARHANKRVVHGGGAVGLQWLDIAVVFAVEGGRRPRAGLGLCGRSGGALGPLCIVLDDLLRGRMGRAAEGRDGRSLCGRGKAACALERLDGSCARLLHGEGGRPRRTIWAESGEGRAAKGKQRGQGEGALSQRFDSPPSRRCPGRGVANIFSGGARP